MTDQLPTLNSRLDKLSILRKNGYSPERLAALESDGPLPAVPDDLTVAPGDVDFDLLPTLPVVAVGYPFASTSFGPESNV
jgi:hypothetical protein